MEKKVHYKMHKVKKNWVAIAVTSLALLVAPKALGLESDFSSILFFISFFFFLISPFGFGLSYICFSDRSCIM